VLFWVRMSPLDIVVPEQPSSCSFIQRSHPLHLLMVFNRSCCLKEGRNKGKLACLPFVARILTLLTAGKYCLRALLPASPILCLVSTLPLVEVASLVKASSLQDLA